MPQLERDLPADRKTAKASGSTRYFTGKGCSHGHVAPRNTSDGGCTECQKLKLRRRHARLRDSEEFRAQATARAMAWYHAQRANPVTADRLRERNAAAMKVWAKANPDRHRETRKRAYIRNYDTIRAAKHNRRAAGRIEPDELRELRRKHGQRCAICGTAGKMTIDHIIPIAAGGKNEKRNIQFLCKPCNSSKQHRAPEEFARRKGLLL